MDKYSQYIQSLTLIQEHEARNLTCRVPIDHHVKMTITAEINVYSETHFWPVYINDSQGFTHHIT